MGHIKYVAAHSEEGGKLTVSGEKEIKESGETVSHISAAYICHGTLLCVYVVCLLVFARYLIDGINVWLHTLDSIKDFYLHPGLVSYIIQKRWEITLKSALESDC